MGSMVTSGNLGVTMISTLAWNVSNVGSTPALGAIFPFFITPITLVLGPTLCMYICKFFACAHKQQKLTIPGAGVCVKVVVYTDISLQAAA